MSPALISVLIYGDVIRQNLRSWLHFDLSIELYCVLKYTFYHTYLIIFNIMFIILKKIKALGFCIAVHRSTPRHKKWSVFFASVLLLIINFVITLLL